MQVLSSNGIIFHPQGLHQATQPSERVEDASSQLQTHASVHAKGTVELILLDGLCQVRLEIVFSGLYSQNHMLVTLDRTECRHINVSKPNAFWWLWCGRDLAALQIVYVRLNCIISDLIMIYFDQFLHCLRLRESLNMWKFKLPWTRSQAPSLALTNLFVSHVQMYNRFLPWEVNSTMIFFLVSKKISVLLLVALSTQASNRTIGLFRHLRLKFLQLVIGSARSFVYFQPYAIICPCGVVV